jgi:methyl coenzyme M reductase subunit C-like uncharacterized protein (methanogenesis marker protein 7)
MLHRQTDIHTIEPLVPELSAFEVELTTEILKGHNSPDVDQIQGVRIKAGGRKIHYEIHKLDNSIWNMEEIPDERRESVKLPIGIKGNKAACNIYRSKYISPTAYTILLNILLSRLTSNVEEITGDHQRGF